VNSNAIEANKASFCISDSPGCLPPENSPHHATDINDVACSALLKCRSRRSRMKSAPAAASLPVRTSVLIFVGRTLAGFNFCVTSSANALHEVDRKFLITAFDVRVVGSPCHRQANLRLVQAIRKCEHRRPLFCDALFGSETHGQIGSFPYEVAQMPKTVPCDILDTSVLRNLAVYLQSEVGGYSSLRFGA
jgi:hypothetical protein